MNKRILLLEDDPSFGYILSEYLKLQQFKLDWVRSAEEALQVLEQHSYRLAILDVMLPGMSGFDLAEIVKRKFPDIPFIFLSAKSLKVDQLKGFKLGAFDYITKPVDEELLVAKIRALLGNFNSEKTQATEYQIGTYTFLPEIFQLRHPAESYKLTPRETALLRLLCEHRRELLPRKKALQLIWGSTDEFTRKSMDVFVSRLRKYLGHDKEVRIENIHGKGFILYG